MATVTFAGGTASGAGGHAPAPGAVAYRPSPWESQDRIDFVGRLAAEGDPGALVAHLLYANGCEGHGAVSRLRAMPEARRRAFADALVEAVSVPGCPGDVREQGMVLLATVSRGFVRASWCEEWTALLEHRAAHWYTMGTDDGPPPVAEALLDAGLPLSDAVVGMLRRSALEGHDWAAVLLERVPLPLLNPGEPWADRIRADLLVLGDPWPALVAHLHAAPAAPTRRWDKAARGLLDDIDAETVRRTVTPWAALAAEGGRAEGGGHDPCDVTAVRGLAWLLSLLPPHPESARTLGALVERPPVKAVVADAAIRALARLEGGAGHAELSRLADRVSHTVTLRRIRRALAP
ncbi:hypothetical protein ACWGJT_07125 [Streptomyces xantholiticus]